MTLVLAVIFVLCIWYGRKYREEEYVIDNYISITCAVLWGVLAFATAWYAPKYFESSEPVSGCIGYVLVKVFDRDIALVSNGRDGYYAKAYDIYLADENDGKDALLKYYKKKVSPDVECFEKGGALFYYISGKEDEELSVATIKEKNGYDMLRVEGTRAFKQRNIWGEYYFGKDIYKKYRKR